MTLVLKTERDLSSLRLIVAAWRRAEWEGRGGNRLAQQLAIYDLAELWRVELVGWGADVNLGAGGIP